MARGYAGSIAPIAQAFQNDPRTRLANSMLATGTSTAPVAQGGWGVTDGLARAAQAIAGAYMNKKNEKKYATREEEYMRGLQDAAALASQPQTQPAIVNPAAINPGTNSMASAAQALVPPQAPPSMTSGQQAPQPLQAFDPGPSSAAQAPGLASLAPPVPPSPPAMDYGPAQVPMAAQQPRPMTGGTGPNGGAPQLSARDLYYNGIVPIEGGTDRNGNFRTSPKGAVGPGQVMPGTAPEAARLAGVPFDENKYRTDAEYNNLLGQAYYEAQLRKFGDPVKAAAAYNAGPGRVQRALRLAQRHGTSWEQHLPEETRNYVQNFSQRVGSASSASGSSGGSDISAVAPVSVQAPTMEQVPNAPQAPVAADRPQAPGLPDEVQSNRIAMAQRLLQSNNPDLVAMAEAYLNTGLDEQNAARMKRSDQQYDRDSMGYQSGLQDFNAGRTDARRFGYDQVSQAQDRNFNREQTYSNQSFTSGESATDRAHQLTLQERQDAAALERERVQSENQTAKFRVPVAAQSAFRGGQAALTNIDEAIALIEANKDAFGMYAYLPDDVLGRLHPEGVAARAAIQNISSLIIHDRSGAAVTAAEYPRLKQFIPRTNEDVPSITEKLRKLRDFQQNELDSLTTMYGADNPYFSGFQQGTQGPVANSSAGWGKVEVVQ